MVVYVYVSAADAVRAGKSKSGSLPVEITPEWLSSLSPELREELALSGAVAHDAAQVVVYGRQESLSVGHPTEPTLAEVERCLALHRDQRLTREATEREERAKSLARVVLSTDDWLAQHPTPESLIALTGGRLYVSRPPDFGSLPTAHPLYLRVEALMRAAEELGNQRLAAEKEEAEQAKAEREREQAEALAMVVKGSGTPSQKERQAAGLLPKDEALALVRKMVFAECDKVAQRYERLSAGDLPCQAADCGGVRADFDVDDAEECPEYAWETLSALRKAMPEGAEAALRSHTATCESCDAKTERLSVLVSLTWHGIELSREYAVPAEESGNK